MSCSRATIFSLILAIFLIAAIIGGYFIFMTKNGDGEESDNNQASSTRLRLSRYDLISDSFRIESSKLDDIKANIDEFLKPYDIKDPKFHQNCDFLRSAPDGKSCGVNIARFDPCTADKSFGISSGMPCVFVKFDADTEFKPEFYEADELPKEIPTDLSQTISSNLRANPRNKETIWISCEGISEEDKRNVGPITILPRNGFLGFYFPCKTEELCTDPLVAIQFRRLQKNVEINVRCRVWAKNAEDKIEFKIFSE